MLRIDKKSRTPQCIASNHFHCAFNKDTGCSYWWKCCSSFTCLIKVSYEVNEQFIFFTSFSIRHFACSPWQYLHLFEKLHLILFFKKMLICTASFRLSLSSILEVLKKKDCRYRTCYLVQIWHRLSGNHWWRANGWTGWSCGSFPTLAILWFYDSMTVASMCHK